MKLALLAKIRHGGLMEVLIDKGWTQADLARAIGTGQNIVSRWMQLKDIPRSAEMRARLEQATGCLYEDLFPPEVESLIKDDFPRDLVAVREVPVHRIPSSLKPLLAPSIEDDALREEQHALLKDAVGQLSPNHQKVLRLRFGLDGEEEHSLAECGVILGVSGSRVREIETEAMRKLRHPSVQYILEGRVIKPVKVPASMMPPTPKRPPPKPKARPPSIKFVPYPGFFHGYIGAATFKRTVETMSPLRLTDGCYVLAQPWKILDVCVSKAASLARLQRYSLADQAQITVLHASQEGHKIFLVETDHA